MNRIDGTRTLRILALNQQKKQESTTDRNSNLKERKILINSRIIEGERHRERTKKK